MSVIKSGAKHDFEGGAPGGQCIEQRPGYTVKTLTFEKGGGVVMTAPPPMVAPPLSVIDYFERGVGGW